MARRAAPGVRTSAIAQPEIARLDELRLGCTLVAEEPLRERSRGQLMLALYRAGRQAEALEAYQNARTALVEELGIEPRRRLRELHQAILNQDPALEIAPQETVRPEPEPAALPEAAPREMRKRITAVFVALSCSSAHSELLDPEALRSVVGSAFGVVESAVERHGGSVETVGGDALTAVFGLPTVHEDDAIRAARAALNARDQLSALGSELDAGRGLRLTFSIGISTGEIVTGGEAASRLRSTGAPLTLSGRLAQSAEQATIVVDEPTRRLVRDAVLAEPVDGGWRVVEIAQGGLVHSSRLASPMVGREREQRRLHDAFEQAVGDRSCQLFTVLGPAGVGKSRLIHEFLADVSDEAVVARGRCLAYGDGITFWPLLQALTDALGLEEADAPEAAREKLGLVLADEPAGAVAAQRVGGMIGFVEAEAGGDEGFAAVQALFHALARARPLVAVIDDIHWAESTFLDLVEHIADASRGAPILLVCLARPELLDVRARELLGSALATYSALGMDTYAAEAGALVEKTLTS